MIRAREANMALTHLLVLLQLSLNDRTRLCDMAEVLNISSAAVTQLADRMESLGLVHRCSLRMDRRAWMLEITDHGFGVLFNIMKP